MPSVTADGAVRVVATIEHLFGNSHSPDQTPTSASTADKWAQSIRAEFSHKNVGLPALWNLSNAIHRKPDILRRFSRGIDDTAAQDPGN